MNAFEKNTMAALNDFVPPDLHIQYVMCFISHIESTRVNLFKSCNS